MYGKGVAPLGGRGDWVPQQWATWTKHLCAGGYWDSARLTFQANDAEVSTLGQARSRDRGSEHLFWSPQPQRAPAGQKEARCGDAARCSGFVALLVRSPHLKSLALSICPAKIINSVTLGRSLTSCASISSFLSQQ